MPTMRSFEIFSERKCGRRRYTLGNSNWPRVALNETTDLKKLMARSFFSGLPSLFAATDEQTMWRVKMDDDPHAFAQLVERWEKPMQRLCARMTGDVHRGEDLAQ